MLTLKKIICFPFVRYVIVGGATNLLGYAVYILITWRCLGPKTAISLMYPFTAILGFYTHGRLSFLYSGCKLKSMWRYIFSHCVGYGINVGLLYFFSDLLGYAHELVQIFAIMVVAGVLFFLFRYFVFPSKA